MKYKFVIGLFALLYPCINNNATVAQKLILKNGSELDGYISMQRPGENFTFTAERAIVYMVDTLVKSIVPVEVGVKDLSSEWVKWAEQHDAFVGVGDNRKLLLSDIITSDNQTINRVRLLERGAKIKYLQIGDHNYSLNWETIALVKVDKRAKTALTGMNRTYKVANGREFTGQYVEEVPGKTLSLYRDTDAVVEVFRTSDVVKYTMQKINPNQPLFEQSELLDILLLKNGSLMKGIIIEQNFESKRSADHCLLLQSEDGNAQSVKLSDIQEYRKEVNPRYKPLYDVLLNEGELVINRQPAHVLSTKEKDGYVIIPQDTCFVTIKGDVQVPVAIETRFALLVRDPSLDIVKVKNLSSRKKEVLYGFSFEDIVKNNMRPVSVATSVNQTTRFEYTIHEKGLYVIYNAADKTVIPFCIE